MPWNRIGKYEVRLEQGQHGNTIYTVWTWRTNQRQSGHWDCMSLAMCEAIRLELEA